MIKARMPWTRSAWLGLTAAAVVPRAARATGEAADASAETVRWFQTTEQALMDAVAAGDKTVWDRTLDASCVVTSEEGQVLAKAAFLDELRPLPKGLTGAITV